ncbi:MAG: hypothetical protein HQL87_07325, partial [Magnetococcales bacterium]|nr:hypothetical protein [Magnetococcales bacterium]
VDTPTPIASMAFSADTTANGGTNNDLNTRVAAQTISGTLSANLATGETVYVSLDNGINWTAATTTVGQNTWSLAGQTLTASNTLEVKVTDTAGNDGPVASQTYILDQTTPTTTINTIALSTDTGTSATDFITNTAAQTINGTLSAALATDETVYVSLDNGAHWTTATTTGQHWSLTGQTLTTSNTLEVKVTNTAGNDGAVVRQAYVLDQEAPTLTVASDSTALKSGETATITFTFSEDPGTTFTNGNIVVDSGTLSAIRGTGLLRTATFTPTPGTAATNATIAVVAGTYTDTAGNAGGSAVLSPIHIDTLPPALAITSDKMTLKAGDTATVTFTFSEDPGATFTNNSVVVRNGTLSAIQGTGLTRTATLTPPMDTASANATITVAEGRYTDAAGNAGGAGTMPTIHIDTLPPTLTVTSDKTALHLGETATVTFTFSEDPGATFTWNGTTGSVTVRDGTLSLISGSGLTRTATFTPTIGLVGNASITVAAGAYADAAGNAGGVSTASININTLPIVVPEPAAPREPAPTPPPATPPAPAAPPAAAPVPPPVSLPVPSPATAPPAASPAAAAAPAPAAAPATPPVAPPAADASGPGSGDHGSGASTSHEATTGMEADKKVSTGSLTTDRDAPSTTGLKQPVAVEGLSDNTSRLSTLVAEGFSGIAAFVKPPEGLVATGSGNPPKVDGLGGSTTTGTMPPVEGFGDNTNNHGLGESGTGFLDREEKEASIKQKRTADTEPESEEMAANAATKAERLNLEPGWEEVANDKASDRNTNQDRGEEPGHETDMAQDEPMRLVPYATLFSGQHRFTAQLKAHGYGGFHEWQMQWMKQLMEERI